jgi:protein FAM32A
MSARLYTMTEVHTASSLCDTTSIIAFGHWILILVDAFLVCLVCSRHVTLDFILGKVSLKLLSYIPFYTQFISSTQSMPGDEYAAAGGSLKLKGVKDSKITKKKKSKKSKAQPENERAGDQAPSAGGESSAAAGEESLARKSREGSLGARVNSGSPAPVIVGKTEAERRHEEMKRKRVRLLFVNNHYTYHRSTR